MVILAGCTDAQSDRLSVAVDSGSVADVQSLLRAGADPNAKRPDGLSPIAAAIKMGHYDVAETLLADGADPNATIKGFDVMVSTASDSGRCPPSLLKSFIKAGRDPNTAFSSISLLTYSLLGGNAGCARVLMDAGADLRAISPAGTTITHAVLMGASGLKSDTVPLLRDVLNAGAPVDPQPAKGDTPLMLAAALDSGTIADEAIEVLLQHGGNPCLTDERGRTAADYARERDHAARALVLDAACRERQARDSPAHGGENSRDSSQSRD